MVIKSKVQGRTRFKKYSEKFLVIRNTFWHRLLEEALELPDFESENGVHLMQSGEREILVLDCWSDQAPVPDQEQDLLSKFDAMIHRAVQTPALLRGEQLLFVMPNTEELQGEQRNALLRLLERLPFRFHVRGEDIL